DEHEAAMRASRIQRAQDLKARIINVSIEGGQTAITIGSGWKQGVIEDMRGYVPGGGGMIADFMVFSVGERTAKAYVELSPDEVQAHPEVVLNPSSLPGQHKTENTPARIIGLSIEGGQTKVMIGRGRIHGVSD